MSTINLPDGYGYVLLAAGAISVVQFGIGGAAMGFRKAFKSPAFLKKPEVIAMQEEHKKVFGTEINEHGYPDMGNGRYAQQLSYKDWVEFNNGQRGHYNMVENSAPILVLVALNGFFQPKIAAALGLSFALGRVLYYIGYTSKSGATGRSFGGYVFVLPATLGLYGMSFYNGLRNIGAF